MQTENRMPNSLQSNSAGNGQNPPYPASLDSTAQNGNANGGDWQEEIYQKIKAMKDMYLLKLTEMYQKIAGKLHQHDSLLQQPQSQQAKNPQFEKLKAFKIMLARFINFLQVSKNNIHPLYKEKLGSYENQILIILSSNRPRKPVSSLHQGHALPPPHMHSIQKSQPPQSQMTQLQPLENQMHPQMQLMNLQGSGGPMQQKPMTSLQHNPSSTLSKFSIAQQSMINTIQSSSTLDPGQNNSMNSLQQVAVGSLQHPASGPQQANMNLLPSQSGMDTLQPNLNPLQPNSKMLQHQHLKQQEQMLQNQQIQQRQMQQHPMHKQLMQQQQQQFQQTKLQQPAQLQSNQMLQLHQMIDSNELKMRQQMGVKSGAFQQHNSSASLDSTAQTGNANGGDWQEEIYQKIKAMKDMYLLKLTEMYQKIAGKLHQHDSLLQQPQSQQAKNPQFKKLKAFKIMLERFINFLQVSKNNIHPLYKEKLGSYENQILIILSSNMPRKPVSSLHQGQGSGGPMQQKIMTSLQHNPSSTLPEISNAQLNMINSIQSSSTLDPERPE